MIARFLVALSLFLAAVAACSSHASEGGSGGGGAASVSTTTGVGAQGGGGPLGGMGGTGGTPVMTFTVGGSVTGLRGKLTLQNNAGDDLDIAKDGTFTFKTPIADQAKYAVTVKSAPGTQDCLVTMGSGVVAGMNVTNVTVDCAMLIFFGATDGKTGIELWKTNGTPAGTLFVKDINPGPSDSLPGGFTALPNGLVVFRAEDGTNGAELWVTDGSDKGTVMVKNIYADGSSYPDYFTAMGNVVYFNAYDDTNGTELWVTDGTAAATKLVKDINPGLGDGMMGVSPVVFQNKLYFVGNDGTHGEELWLSDGTAANTAMVKDIYPAAMSSSPDWLTVVGNTLYFSAETPPAGVNPGLGRELWSHDGMSTTQLVKDIGPGPYSSYPERLVAFGGKLYFFADDSKTGSELWVSDGTVSGTTQVKDCIPGSAGGSQELFAGSKQLFFPEANGGAGGAPPDTELWSSDGTGKGTALLKDIAVGLNASSYPGGFFASGKLVLFSAYEQSAGRELWQTDGTPAGTTLLKDINKGDVDSSPDAPLGAIRALWVFYAYDDVNAAEPRVTDGTTAGTILLKDICPGLCSSNSQPAL